MHDADKQRVLGAFMDAVTNLDHLESVTKLAAIEYLKQKSEITESFGKCPTIIPILGSYFLIDGQRIRLFGPDGLERTLP